MVTSPLSPRQRSVIDPRTNNTDSSWRFTTASPSLPEESLHHRLPVFPRLQPQRLHPEGSQPLLLGSTLTPILPGTVPPRAASQISRRAIALSASFSSFHLCGARRDGGFGEPHPANHPRGKDERLLGHPDGERFGPGGGSPARRCSNGLCFCCHATVRGRFC